MSDVLVVGVSTRACAASAARAGFAVTAIDAFGDRDQHPGVVARALPRDLGVPFRASAAVAATANIECDAVAYLAPFENHAGAVAALARGRELLGNPPGVLRRVRDPWTLTDALRRGGFRTPKVCRALPPDETGAWLVKPVASGGGQGIRRWQPGAEVPGHTVLQEYVPGAPASVVFLAAGGRVHVLGLSHQIIGDPAFGASGFRYCGSILHSRDDRDAGRFSADVVTAVGALARQLAGQFGLAGLNGADVIVRDDEPWPVEVNPRWSSSMELVERRDGGPLFDLHARACRSRTLPDVTVRTGGLAEGKAIVFARRDVVTGDTGAWLRDPDIQDVPYPGERIAAGHPVCTVFARAPGWQTCYAALVQRAAAVHEELERWRASAAFTARSR